MARGRPRLAAALLERRLHQLGVNNLKAAPLLLGLAEADIAAGDLGAARSASRGLARLAGLVGGRCLRGLAALAGGLVSAAEGGDPMTELEEALDHLGRAQMAWEAARARLAMAEAVAKPNPELATREARLAMEAFDSLGARPGADRARSVLRRLGVRIPAGSPAVGGLSRREKEVAGLVGLGLSNDQIARRLFLSVRTVEHHVTSILRKLPATSRAEIAAYAVRHLGSDSG